jgi:protein tyrosine phosphatase
MNSVTMLMTPRNTEGQMLWAQRVEVIVMLTGCVENGVLKCNQYWPSDGDTPAVHDDVGLVVTFESVAREEVFEVKTFTL